MDFISLLKNADFVERSEFSIHGILHYGGVDSLSSIVKNPLYNVVILYIFVMDNITEYFLDLL